MKPMTNRDREIMELEKADRDRIIRGLVCCGTKEHCHYGEDGCPWYFPENPDDCTARLARAAVTYIATLEEQAKEQEQTVEFRTVRADGGEHYPFWDTECTGCGYRMKTMHADWQYCPMCGRKVKWDD